MDVFKKYADYYDQLYDDKDYGKGMTHSSNRSLRHTPQSRSDQSLIWGAGQDRMHLFLQIWDIL